MNDKTAVRNLMKTKRAAFSGSDRKSADEAIYKNFLSEFGGFDSFFIYNSLPEETDTRRIIASLLKDGKRVYLPRVEGENIVAVPFGQVKKGAFGVEEPCGQACLDNIQVTVVPLLAINSRGLRIGFGRGFYDRYLKEVQTKKVGLGYFFQIAEFKEDEWDEPLDTFVCERGIYRYEDNIG